MRIQLTNQKANFGAIISAIFLTVSSCMIQDDITLPEALPPKTDDAGDGNLGADKPEATSEAVYEGANTPPIIRSDLPIPQVSLPTPISDSAPSPPVLPQPNQDRADTILDEQGQDPVPAPPSIPATAPGPASDPIPAPPPDPLPVPPPGPAPVPPPGPVPVPAPAFLQTLPNGKYLLRGSISGRCLDIPGNSTNLGLQVQIFACNNNPAQLWTLTHIADDFYKITNENGNSLEVRGGTVLAGSAVQTSVFSSKTFQLFKFNKVGENFVLTVKDSVLAFDTVAQSLIDRAKIVIAQRTDSDGEKWVLISKP